LLDEGVCARIAALAGDLVGRHVLEVGPGPGGLTRALLSTEAAEVVAVELDRRAVAALAELAAAHPGRLRVVEGDALAMDPAVLLPRPPRRVVANLPYNVATPLLVRWLRGAAALEGMTLMFQQEVAERIAAAATPMAGLACWRSGAARSRCCCACRRVRSARRPRCGRPWSG
jgi:16S rRNA (adenine1518-N6/adenine1519-N6)-dimethyltransferase